jgi:hypothetical protein
MRDGFFLSSVLTGTLVALICGHSLSGLEPAKPATATPFTFKRQEGGIHDEVAAVGFNADVTLPMLLGS